MLKKKNLFDNVVKNNFIQYLFILYYLYFTSSKFIAFKY